MTDSNEKPEQMTSDEFNRAQFFSSDEEFAKAKARSKRGRDPLLRALVPFTRALEAAPSAQKYATIRWLVAKYLGD